MLDPGSTLGYASFVRDDDYKLLRGGFVVGRVDVDDGLAGFAGEADLTVNQRENRMIAAETDVFARLVRGSALANNDIAGGNGLTAIDFNAKTAACRIASVTGTATCLMMCHLKNSSFLPCHPGKSRDRVNLFTGSRLSPGRLRFATPL
jgi:hypothetical protein